MPLALWWHGSSKRVEHAHQQPQAECQKQERQDHLDQAYGDLLSGHNDGDPVQGGCHQLEELPCLRRDAISHPLTKDLVLLLDHPDRHPWAQPGQLQGSTTRSA